MRRLVAVLALVAALALPGSALAATINGVSNESLTISATSTVTGVPATTDYGTAIGGSTSVGPSWPTVTLTTNVSAGMIVQYSATTMTRSGDVQTIPITNRKFAASAVTGCTAAAGFVDAVNYANGTSGLAYAGPAGANVVICTTSAAGSVTVANFTPKITIPAGQTPGLYVGIINLKLTEN